MCITVPYMYYGPDSSCLFKLFRFLSIRPILTQPLVVVSPLVHVVDDQKQVVHALQEADKKLSTEGDIIISL